MARLTPRILAVASQGPGSHDEARLRALLEGRDATFFPFDCGHKVRSFRALIREVSRSKPDLVCLEGTGIAAGLALLVSRFSRDVRYLVSSGDAVGPFVHAQVPALGPAFTVYERALCRFSDGFVGWTPYLTGRALTYGAPRAMTAPGWAPSQISPEERARGRFEVRRRLGIPADAVVIGIAGSLSWNTRAGFCYGKECVASILLCKRPDIHALIVGDGTGRQRLEALAGESLGKRIHLVGQVPREQIPIYLAAMDVGSLPQSVDRVGSFRYSTKLPEYVEASLPIVTGQIPLSYDMPPGGLWRLPGNAPWEPGYIRALAELLEGVSREELELRARSMRLLRDHFDQRIQVKAFNEFLDDLLCPKNWRPHQA